MSKRVKRLKPAFAHIAYGIIVTLIIIGAAKIFQILVLANDPDPVEEALLNELLDFSIVCAVIVLLCRTFQAALSLRKSRP